MSYNFKTDLAQNSTTFHKFEEAKNINFLAYVSILIKIDQKFFKQYNNTKLTGIVREKFFSTSRFYACLGLSMLKEDSSKMFFLKFLLLYMEHICICIYITIINFREVQEALFFSLFFFYTLTLCIYYLTYGFY